MGVANIQNWARNGTTYRTSLYWTFKAESQRPTPKEVINASRKNATEQSNVTPGRKPMKIMNIKRMTNPTRKSSKPDSTEEIGMASRGK